MKMIVDRAHIRKPQGGRKRHMSWGSERSVLLLSSMLYALGTDNSFHLVCLSCLTCKMWFKVNNYSPGRLRESSEVGQSNVQDLTYSHGYINLCI